MNEERENRMKLLFVSLGCDKNRVDSEVMLGLCKKNEETEVNSQNIYILSKLSERTIPNMADIKISKNMYLYVSVTIRTNTRIHMLTT